jgi:micrococcal nuclease
VRIRGGTQIDKIIVAALVAIAAFFSVLTGEDLMPTVDTESTEITTQDYQRVERIIDGDTFVISGDERVRMLGIDTPERGKLYYKEAAAYLATLIDGKMVQLEKDRSERDRYGRLLRHVYVDGVWINEKMIADGYARFVTYPPDVMHVATFQEREREAREAKRGLWGIENSQE